MNTAIGYTRVSTEEQGRSGLGLDAAQRAAILAHAEAKGWEVLCAGQQSRHGGSGYRKPAPAEAEATMLLAVPLMQWFTSEVLQRRPAAP